MEIAKTAVKFSAPVDKYNLAYIFLLLHGIGFLLPWNVFINAREYFVDYKLNTTESYYADYRQNFMSYLGFAAFFPGLCFAAWNTFYQSAATSSSPVFRFVTSMILEVVVLTFTIALVVIDTSTMPEIFFALTIASVVIINCCVGIHQTLTFGIAALLPMKYSNGVVIGTNACGTIISLVNIFTKALAIAYGRSQRSIIIAAVAYFTSALGFIIACIVTFFWLRRLEFVRYYTSLSEGGCIATDEDSEVGKPLNTILLSVNGAGDTVDFVHPVEHKLQPMVSAGGDVAGSTDSDLESVHLKPESGLTTLRNCFGLCCYGSPTGRTRCGQYWRRYVTTFKECWPHCLNVWAVFFCSLSMFPALQSRVVPVSQTYFIPPEWFVDITCFLFFNFFAMLGCIVSNRFPFPSAKYLWIPVWIRVAFFIPFFLFCNYGLSQPRMPVLIANDHAYVLGAVLFSFTNGYLSSLAMMYAPRNSPPERAGLAGMLAAFFLVSGVFSGVYSSRGFASIIF